MAQLDEVSLLAQGTTRSLSQWLLVGRRVRASWYSSVPELSFILVGYTYMQIPQPRMGSPRPMLPSASLPPGFLFSTCAVSQANWKTPLQTHTHRAPPTQTNASRSSYRTGTSASFRAVLPLSSPSVLPVKIFSLLQGVFDIQLPPMKGSIPPTRL